MSDREIQYLHFKKLGNEYVMRAKKESDCAKARSMLQTAMNHYYGALKYAMNRKEKSSANKNLTQPHRMLAELEDTAQELKLYHFEQCITHLNDALYDGLQSQSEEWGR